MTIRPATAGDVSALVAMGAHFITDTSYRDRIGLNADALETLALRLIDRADSAVLVLEVDGAVVGMFGVMVFAHPMSGERTASEVFWWVEPAHRGGGVRLLHAAERWARERGAARLQMIAPNQDVARFYERVGFVEVERLYQRSLA